ncbi:MAG: HipA N-terminal domain-containing protein, partial [Nitrososphaerales archaeon]
MSGLAIWMYDTRVGVLSRQRGNLSFAYTPEGLDLGLGVPLLSVSMPTRGRAYGNEVTSAFFSGLLPEGEPRQIIAYDLNLSERDAYGLLRALGRDCAGALVVVPDGETLEEEGVPEPITDAEVARRLRKLRVQPLGVDQRVRVSLAGMQRKLLLSRLENGWGLPVDGAPSTHIVKPANRYLRNVVANEALCVRVARELGLPAA